jgi:hypothetical protein
MSAAAFVIDDELAAFLESGNGMMVATRSAALHPHAVRACGVRALDRSRIAVLVPKATGGPVRSDLENNGDVAVTVCSPHDYRTIQLKGTCVVVDEASPDDVRWSHEQLRRFAAAIAPFGHTRQQARNMWLFDLWRLEIVVSAAFLQTPGPGAGATLEVAR